MTMGTTMADEQTPPKPKSKGGAPPGNKNALRHGLYAKHFDEQARFQLGEMPPLESLHEVYMLRDRLDKILDLIEECDDEDRRVKLYNSLFSGAQRLLFAMRTHTYLVGDNKEILTDFWKALESFQDEMNL
jgi:hypothetical protein